MRTMAECQHQGFSLKDFSTHDWTRACVVCGALYSMIEGRWFSPSDHRRWILALGELHGLGVRKGRADAEKEWERLRLDTRREGYQEGYTAGRTKGRQEERPADPAEFTAQVDHAYALGRKAGRGDLVRFRRRARKDVETETLGRLYDGGLSQTALARALGVDQSTVSRRLK